MALSKYARTTITFEDVRPDLKKYYKPELNNGMFMNDFSKSNHTKIVLCCDICGWKKTNTIIKTYTRWHPAGYFYTSFKCVYCNSLGMKFPEIASQWNYDKNIDTPFDYTFSSRYKAHWKCECGHEWQININSRTALDTWCPKCSSSKGEKQIANFLEENNIEYTSQHFVIIEDIRRYFDFYIPEGKIFVEVHGRQHFEDCENYFNYNKENQLKIDKQKQTYAEAHGTYIMVDYREHDPELALERFINKLAELA